MSAVDVTEVPAKFNELLEAVQRGESFEITRDGKSVARLSPAIMKNVVVFGGKRLPDMSEFRASIKVNKLGNSVIEGREEERY